MATVTFTDDPMAEARAIIAALSLLLQEHQRPEQAAPPARGYCKYDESGNLRKLTVTLGDEK
ncbi:hypothetical protein ABGT18_09820 [Pseudomonas putida]|uniref:hypothetical protein n=1 Tax=Pseudomonas putida TaxID=303 RepID=UPI00345CF58F